MAKQEAPSLYRHVTSVSVPGFIVEKLGEDQVQANQTPFKEGYLPDFSRLVRSDIGTGWLNPTLVQVSPSQKRAFELRYGETSNVFWADEYGNPYGVLQEKGGNVTDPGVRVEPRAPSGFIIWGIQDSDSILRTVRASNLMRSARIGTEALVRLTEPEELRFRGKKVSRDEFKKQLVKRVWDENHQSNTGLEGGWTAATRDDVPKLAGELKDMTFYLTTLGRQVSERFHDLKYVNSAEDLQKVMQRVFTFWNLKQEFLDQGSTLDSANPQDLLRFFSDLLPTEVAKNYAALHNLRLVHTFPHLGNVSLAGTIYDLDSAYGEPLGIGDKVVTDEDIKDEIACLIAGKEGWQQADGILPLLDGLERKKFYQEGHDFDEIDRKFAKTFALKYVEDRRWLKDFPTNLENIEAVFRICRVYLETDEAAVAHLAEKMGQDNAELLHIRSAFSEYPFPLMFDINKRPFQYPDGKDLSETTGEPTEGKERDELIKSVKSLLQLHQINLLTPPSTYPATGADFFSFEQANEGILRLHQNILSKTDVANILRMHMNGELEELSAGYEPRTLGSFMLTLAQLNTKHLAEAVISNAPSHNDPQFMEKLSRINEFVELLPPRSTHYKMELVRGYVSNVLRGSEDRSKDDYYLKKEIDYRTAISLFGRGIITYAFHEMFNHRVFDAIRNEFTDKQKEALQQALECPDLIDKLMGPENTTYLLQLALTGVQVRSGQTKDLALVDKSRAGKPSLTSNLQYFFASQDQDQIKDKKLRRLLSKDPDKARNLDESSWTVGNIESILRAGIPLHPDSFLAATLKEADLWVDDLAVILKTAVDIYEGDLSKMDPVLKEILESKQYGHMLNTEHAGELMLSCVAFGIDLPKMLDTSFMGSLEFHSYVYFLEKDAHKEGGVYRRWESYPVSPVYKLMSEGMSALPEKIRVAFKEAENNQEFVNIFAKELLHALFTNDCGYAGYFRNYFGGMIRSDGYPPATEEGLNKYEKFTKDSGRFGWKIWNIVHPDIWDMISKADDDVLKDYIVKSMPDGIVKIGITHHKNGMVGQKDSDLIEVLPPHLYGKVEQFAKIAKAVSKGAKIISHS